MTTSCEALKYFVLGGSFLITIFPLIYTGIPYSNLSSNDKKKAINLTYMTIAIPFIYGFVYMTLTILLKPRIQNDRLRLVITGVIAGLIYALIGVFVFDLPRKVYKMNNPFLVFLIAPVIYALIYGFIMYEYEKIM